MLAFIRRALDRIYLISGFVGAVSLLAILLLIVAQMLARWSGMVFPGSTAYAGYAMATASFLSFAYALNKDSHIRVSLLLNRMRGRRWLGEVWCFAAGVFLSTYLCFYSWRTIQFSHLLNDVSQGQDATPLWIPQLSMGIGSAVLALAFWDNLICLLARRQHNMQGDHLSDKIDE